MNGLFRVQRKGYYHYELAANINIPVPFKRTAKPSWMLPFSLVFSYNLGMGAMFLIL
jgi:hypothetical protein